MKAGENSHTTTGRVFDTVDMLEPQGLGNIAEGGNRENNRHLSFDYDIEQRALLHTNLSSVTN